MVGEATVGLFYSAIEFDLSASEGLSLTWAAHAIGSALIAGIEGANANDIAGVVGVAIDANLYDIDFHPLAVDLFSDGGNYRASRGLLVQ
jgi:hypothetical protein